MHKTGTVTVTDPLGGVTVETYDAEDRLVALVLPDPDGAGPLASPAASLAYDAEGSQDVEEVRAMVRMESFEYPENEEEENEEGENKMGYDVPKQIREQWQVEGWDVFHRDGGILEAPSCQDFALFPIHFAGVMGRPGGPGSRYCPRWAPM